MTGVGVESDVVALVHQLGGKVSPSAQPDDLLSRLLNSFGGESNCYFRRSGLD